jgi:nickel-type superoxide dismutase maturation protease
VSRLTRLSTAGAALAATVLLVKRPVFRVVVEGPSMLPELAPGDRLIALRTPVLERGDLVAVRDPEERERILVKRVRRLHATTVEVVGDNAAASRDSRQFGPVARSDVLGRIVYRYHPQEAAQLYRRGSRYHEQRRWSQTTDLPGDLEP